VGHDPRSTLLRAIGGPAQSRLLRRASAVLVLTEGVAERLVAAGIPASRVRVVPLGIDLDHARSLTRPASMEGRRWIVYVGRLVREKGVRELLEAYRRLPVDTARLLIVGDGRDRAALEVAADRLGAADRVRFVGAVPHSDVRPYVEHADVLVLPSWYEERGRVLLEAMAAGTPVVATRTGGIPATVRDGENGLLVPPRDVGALSAAIARVLDDAELAGSMGAAGRRTAAAHGTDALVDTVLATYEAVLHPATEPRGTSLQQVGVS
jgi:glycogen(starch) synthase